MCSRSFSRHPVLRAELLEHYEHVTFNDEGLKLTGAALVAFLKGHQKIISALEIIDDAVLDQLEELKVLSKYGVGVDMIDFKALEDHQISFGWTGGVNRRSVSELVISYAIALLRHIPKANHEVRQGTWRQHVGGEMSGRTIGIIGCGNIGKDLVKLLKPFGCPVLVNDIVDYTEFYQEHDIRSVSLEALLEQSDIVTLHVPLDASTSGMITADRLALMKRTAILINLARGGLVDEAALKAALQQDRLAAAALDVFAVEPPEDSALLNLPNFLATPHLGGSAEEGILAMGRAAIKGLDDNAIPRNA